MENMTKTKEKSNNKGSLLALSPILVFLVLFLGSGIITGDFYKMPALTAFVIAAGIAFMINPKESLDTKMEVFCKSAGDSNILIMLVIFLLAGAFGSVAKAMGGVDSTVNLSLSVLPPNLLVPGLFLVVCFISTSMGTSVGTISALTPIALGISEKTGMPLELLVAIIVGGSMVGDNLSMISDTTIAAASTQGCQMKDKVKMNFFVVLPAALISLVIIAVISSGYGTTSAEAGSFEIIKVVPYVAVLVGALAGANVFVLLGGGILFAGAIGIFTNTIDIWGFIGAVSEGMAGMQELCILVLVVGGVIGLIKHNGGIEFILNFITSKIKTATGAKFGIALLASIIDLCTANNTITIITAGPLAKDIGEKYDLDPRKIASMLDIFASCWQGMIPYGAQILTAVGIAGVSSVAIIKYLHYPIFLLIFGIISITIDFSFLKKKKKAN
ncbi:Na+/H+ antiporter NhaC family protein [Romboutsia sedimentorum]|uniref:Na+/H+ antiporter NhaC family protein n=1 Tax=Romboutsia sedimentorum TaxID=1368474 RepID=A0ABT7EC30_9FIRM|nr:Na+/H+ antiporter NhaC family protein [Romboutsia sedimentorum]MDK2564494.1 Na+/H+ antiporter NhaC family protein [Romboutsia sedimentorum]MDK2586615.1 Na+/H+ antiporter NhaC family protein [Romboutsia sedimentorum]